MTAVIDIRLDFAGLSRTVAELLGGVEVPVDVDGFSNDRVTFRNKDDVLTQLIHLSYLAYDQERKIARIPNEEIRREFQKSIKEVDRAEAIARVATSVKLIEDTVHGDEAAVAQEIERVHAEWPSLYHNTEQALRSTIKLAYFSYADHYLRFEELPAGAGVADIVYLPKRDSPTPHSWRSSSGTPRPRAPSTRFATGATPMRSRALTARFFSWVSATTRTPSRGTASTPAKLSVHRRVPSGQGTRA